MAFDGIAIAAIISELAKLVGGRVDKIHQPEKDEIVLLVRSSGGNHKLLLCANANFSRLHLIDAAKQNPMDAPMFCMLLRKHLQGGRIISITQPDFERIVHITIENRDEMGDIAQKILIIEIMGKHSNIILTNGDIVLDSARHVSYGQSAVRQILPGRKYVAAPGQNKLNPTKLNQEQFYEICHNNKGLSPQKLVYLHYTGISPSSAAIICRIAGLDADIPLQANNTPLQANNTPLQAHSDTPLHENNDMHALYTAFKGVMDDIAQSNLKPYIMYSNNATPIGFGLIGRDTCHEAHVKDFDSASEMAQHYFLTRDTGERVRQKSQDMRRHINNLIERSVKKAHIQDKTLEDIKERDRLKLYGELITANIYAIAQGANQFVAQNFYEENMPDITIKLDPIKTPNENAQAYFAKYNKQKRTYKALQEQIKQNKEELDYLQTVLIAIDHCDNDADLAQIRLELYEQGFVKRRDNTKSQKNNKNNKNNNHNKTKARPLHYISSDGFDIYVGKNNAQNDELTMRIAQAKDIWLHTKNYPGSHVILKAKEDGRISQKALEEAANLAAYYSKGRGGSLVPIDYCPRKLVKKPSGAKPGFVIYQGHKTAYITPDEGLVNSMQKG